MAKNEPPSAEVGARRAATTIRDGDWTAASYGAEIGKPTIMRMNDGAMVILAPDPTEGDDESRRAIIHVLQKPGLAKRGQAWQTTDHEQEALAKAIMALPDMVSALRTFADDERFGAAAVARSALTKAGLL